MSDKAIFLWAVPEVTDPENRSLSGSTYDRMAWGPPKDQAENHTNGRRLWNASRLNEPLGDDTEENAMCEQQAKFNVTWKEDRRVISYPGTISAKGAPTWTMLWDGKAMGEMGVQLRVREFPYEGRTVPYTSIYPEQSSFLPATESPSPKKRRSELSKIRYLIVPSVVMSVSKTREEEQNQGSAADQATLTTIAKALISQITFDPKEMPEAIADSARSRDWKKMFRAYLTVHVPKVLDGMSLDGTSLGLSNIQLMRTPAPAGGTSGFQTLLKENELEEFVPKIKEYPTDCDLSPTRMLAETGERQGIRTERHFSSANPDDKGRESTFAYRLQGREAIWTLSQGKQPILEFVPGVELTHCGFPLLTKEQR